MITLFRVRYGSKVYGTDNQNSDDDEKFVYLQTPEDHFKNGYIPYTEINKDNVGYELTEFLKLLKNNNPMAVEMLHTPEEFVIECHELFEILLQNRHETLSKNLYYSFSSFATAQIKKARNTDNRFNLENKKVERKTPLDFCYIVIDQIRDNLKNKQGMLTIVEFLKIHNSEQTDFIVNKMEHSKELFTLFKSNTKTRGIVSENSTNLNLQSSELGSAPFAYMIYNEDAYRSHCKEYNQYQEWLKNRNPQRFTDIQNSNQKIDGKNAYHTVRLLNMCYEIFTTGEVIVDRRNIDAEYLKQIRIGSFDLEKLLTDCEIKLEEISKFHKTSNLPNVVNAEKLDEILENIKSNFLETYNQPNYIYYKKYFNP